MKHNPVTPEYLTAAYVCVSVLVFMLLCMLVYVTCSRKFKLNWYERTQLESAKGFDDMNTLSAAEATSKDALVQHSSTRDQGQRFLRSQSSNARLDSPSTSKEFWVPISIQRQASFCQSDGPNEFSGDESAPDTPNTPLGIKVSPFALSHMSQPERGVSPLVKAVQPPTQGTLRPKVVSMYGKLDHTKINANLYLEEKENESEFQDEDGPGGSVNFAVSYNPQYSLLCVHLIKARNLISRDISGTADVYAMVRLFPDGTTYRNSTTHWKTLNPDFDEELVFDVAEPDLKDLTLEIFFFDYDVNSRDQCLGRAELPLNQVNFQENVVVSKGVYFSDQRDGDTELGDLMFSVGYLQSAERLTVVILKARNLKPTEEGRSLDPYVKVALLQNGKRLKKKKKTNVQKGNTSPVFNEALSFNGINKEVLKTLTIEVSIMNGNIMGQSEILGNVFVGSMSKGEEALHRQNFLSGRSAVAVWHAITTAPASTSPSAAIE